MTPLRLIFPIVSPSPRLGRRPHHLGLFCWIAVIISTPVDGAVRDSLVPNIVTDSASAHLLRSDSTKAFDSVQVPDSSRIFNSLKVSDSAETPNSATVPDSTIDSLKNAVNFDSCMIVGAGIGLSVGSIPLFSLWEGGLPKSLADLGISDSFLRQPTDSSLLSFSLEENPDIYNMVFPLSISFNRCFEKGRLGSALSFSMISKKYASGIAIEADSLRRIDVRHKLTLYTLTLDLLYGRKFPTRYFSVDGVDRTDAIIGISIAPLLALKKTSSIRSRTVDPRFTAIADSLGKDAGSFSAYGMAFGWRAGIMTLRRLSRQGGVEAGISYYGVWSGRFRSSGVPLMERQVSGNGTDKKEIGSMSHRIEISVALVRKVF